MRRSLAQLLQDLDQWSESVPLSALESSLRQTALSYSDVSRFVAFGERTYRRNLLHDGPAYHALVLCWRSGQRSPIHDHAGSSCAVHVLKGRATETLFSRTEHGMIYATSTRTMQEGDILGSFDADIHQISNLEGPGEDLVTLHLYSPPLFKMNLYSLTDGSVLPFYDQVEYFSEGAGI